MNIKFKHLCDRYGDMAVMWAINSISKDCLLTNKQYAVLVLHFYHGYNVTSIAKRLGKNKSTISRHLSRAYDKILEAIEFD